MTTITAELLGPLLADAHVPRVTWYGAGGARTELSTASLANWSAKVAGLLVDELGGRAGDLVHVSLPAGWQSAPILLGGWWAGMVITDHDDPNAIAAFVPDGADPADGAADEVFVVSGHPLGAPSRSVAAHQRDFTGAVLPQADRFTPRSSVAGSSLALTGSTAFSVAEVLDMARSFAAALGRGGRLLCTRVWALPEPALPVLLGALAAAGSLIQLDPPGSATDPTPQRPDLLARSERATQTVGARVAGLPELLR